MPLSVSDVRSNRADQIVHAVEVLGRAKQRIAIFRAIYFGKQRTKTVNEIATATGLPPKRVVEEGKRLADNQVVKQIRTGGMTAYQKDPFYTSNKTRILALVQDPVAVARIPTKRRPQVVQQRVIEIRVPRPQVKVRFVTVDDIDSFSRVKEVSVTPGDYSRVPEATFKRSVAKILREEGKFQDWGGERNDLYTTKVRIRGRRYRAAFAFKGPGTRGILVPSRMGKAGNQIQRLIKTPADVFILQYWGQIGEDVVEQMEELAKARAAVEGTVVFYGTIDGDDSNRLRKAYPKAFQR